MARLVRSPSVGGCVRVVGTSSVGRGTPVRDSAAQASNGGRASAVVVSPARSLRVNASLGALSAVRYADTPALVSREHGRTSVVDGEGSAGVAIDGDARQGNAASAGGNDASGFLSPVRTVRGKTNFGSPVSGVGTPPSRRVRGKSSQANAQHSSASHASLLKRRKGDAWVSKSDETSAGSRRICNVGSGAAMQVSKKVGGKRNEEQVVEASASRGQVFSFTPACVDSAKCLGRTWNSGKGGQCPRYPLGDEAVEGQQRDLCMRCQTNKHGRVDGPVPEGKLKEFEKHAAKATRSAARVSAVEKTGVSKLGDQLANAEAMQSSCGLRDGPSILRGEVMKPSDAGQELAAMPVGGAEPRSASTFNDVLGALAVSTVTVCASETAVSCDGSFAEAREVRALAAESRVQAAASRGIGDHTRLTSTLGDGQQCFGASARHRLRAQLDEARARSAVQGAGGSAASAECSSQHHVCRLDPQTGCGSCQRTCHRNCDSVLCSFEPCCYCTSMRLVTHENSELCIEAQRDRFGCHACGRAGCWSSAAKCYAKCNRKRHVCSSLRTGGCTSCGHVCHVNNSDVRCTYFSRRRGDITWQANAQALLDTLHGSRVDVPHVSQVTWRFDGQTELGSDKIILDGVPYVEGFGNPGRRDDGEQNNCLIDSLRQCLSIECDRGAVRHDLVSEFAGSIGRACVTEDSYLDVEEHGPAILRSLFRHSRSDLPSGSDLGEYCIVALAANRENHGVVVGNVRASHRLVVFNHMDVHFNPCLRLD